MLFEKYRPSKFEELVGREKQVEQIKNMVNGGEPIPHLLLYGPPGTGKTTFAKVIANEILQTHSQSNFYEFNASKDRGIDFIRNDITEIAKRRAFGTKYKIILMDESDYITPEAQACFRRILEEYQKSTRFIFTANYPYKLIPALHSRFVSVEFPVLDTKTIAQRLKFIAKQEDMKIDDKSLIVIGKECNGDLRKAINMLQGGTVESEVVAKFDTLTLSKMAAMSSGDRIMLAFTGDPDQIFAKLWEMVQKEEAWEKIELMAACNHKMNMSVHKTLFLAHLLDKSFG